MDEISTRYHESMGRNPHENPSRQVSARTKTPSPGCVGGPNLKIVVDDKRASIRDHRSVTNDVYVTSHVTRPRRFDSAQTQRLSVRCRTLADPELHDLLHCNHRQMVSVTPRSNLPCFQRILLCKFYTAGVLIWLLTRRDGDYRANFAGLLRLRRIHSPRFSKMIQVPIYIFH